MTATSAIVIPSLPPLDFEDHETHPHHDLLNGLRGHMSDIHGAPKTTTVKSMTDQTAQYVEALKREAFGSHVDRDVGEDRKPASTGEKLVTEILDDPHAVRVDGGTEKYFRSNDRAIADNQQHLNERSLSTGTFGSGEGNSGQMLSNRQAHLSQQESDITAGKGSFGAESQTRSHPNTIEETTPTAQINPFHRLSYPDGSSPPWIAKPLAESDGFTHAESALAPLVHIKRVSRDTVVLVPGTPATDQIQPTSSSLDYASYKVHSGQQLQITNGHLAVVETTEEKKVGFFSKFERAFGRGTESNQQSPSPINGSHSATSQSNISADFLPQHLPGDQSNEVHGNAPPSPPISNHENGIEHATVPAPLQENRALLSSFPNPFQQPLSLQRGSLGYPPLTRDGDATVGGELALSPRSRPNSLFAGPPADLSIQRSISGQSFTSEPEPIEDEPGSIRRQPPRRPSINTSMLEVPVAGVSDVSANSSPTNSMATPADRTVVLAPPVLTGTTRSGSIAAIKRGIGKSPSATGSGRNSVAGASTNDAENRVSSPASFQASGRRLSADRHSHKGRSSMDQNSQNSLGLGIPSNPAQGTSYLSASVSQPLSLAPPIMPERRNTTSGPSSPRATSRSPLMTSQSQLQVPQSPTGSTNFGGGLLGARKRQMTDVPGLDGSALDPDILAEADRLRKERMNRRQRQKSGSEEEPPRLDADGAPPSQPSAEEANGEASVARFESHLKQKERQMANDIERVMVGNLIGEDHVNYVLMYNMLTGIRIGVSMVIPASCSTQVFFCLLTDCALQVSRCQAKMKRPVTDADYTAKHKYSFDM